MPMLPSLVPIFPLPNAVLFPNVFLPLRIFEPRYREMVQDALSADRIIGMVLLKPGFEHAYDGRPPVYAVGCAGVITYAERLADGRYDIVLRGLEKFRIAGEDSSKPYRMARIDSLPEIVPHAERTLIGDARQRLESILGSAPERSQAGPRFPPAVPDEDLINALAQYTPADPLERQALLERNGLLARCRGLIELLEMRTMAPPGTTWNGGALH